MIIKETLVYRNGNKLIPRFKNKFYNSSNISPFYQKYKNKNE